MLNQDVHSVTPGGTSREDVDENHKNRTLEKNNNCGVEVGASFTWGGHC